MFAVITMEALSLPVTISSHYSYAEYETEAISVSSQNLVDYRFSTINRHSIHLIPRGMIP